MGVKKTSSSSAAAAATLGGSKTATSEVAHDPGGKVRLRLPDGVIGNAVFSPCERYRWRLDRELPGAGEGAILWVGMNPSTADGEVDDPTCRRELGFSSDWGFRRYLKANVLGWRASMPRDLPKDPGIARGDDNLAHI